MKKRLERRSLLLLFLLLIFCVAASIQINEKAKKNRLNLKTGSTEEFRKLGMEEAFFQVLAKTDHEKRGRLYAIYFLENSLFPQDNEKELFEKWSEKEEWKSFEKICTALWNDIRYFPVPESPKHPQYQVSFVDSWMGERTYGGKRGHEGCDLMASKDIPGLYPVVSMTDGVVSARGWLEKGGYRIGITAPSGAYFYYAHLDSYGSYQEGDEVKAGDIIGFMGNTGYGPEGTKGMFATHLHLGIYLYPDGEETSYNPYWILRLAFKTCRGEKTFLFFLTMLYLNDMEDERMINLPNEFEEKMKALLGDEFEDYIKCYDEPRYYGLRVNTEKISVEDFVKICPFEITPIPWIDNGFYYDGEKISPAKHPYYFAGLYYLQEPSAMTPANRLPVEPGDRVLDVCAAPGGKATELGAKLQNEGVLVANDISSSRARGLLKNLEVFGIGNMLVMSEEPGRLERYFSGYFDKILIDAPCSGEGMFRKDKKMVRAWEEHGPEFFSKLQRSIITQAARMLKPGGMMLYSTCTFDPLENEGTIEYLLGEYPEFEIQEIAEYEGFAPGRPEVTKSKDPDFAKTVRIFPHHMKGEGHYLALLKKSEDAICPSSPVAEQKAKKIPAELEEFFRDVKWDLKPWRLDIHGERVYYMPENLPELKGARFLRSGLLLGELKKKRFEPSQALAMNLKMEEYAHTLNLSSDDDRLMRYLKGETIDAEDLIPAKAKGWHLICTDGFPLGWGKVTNGTLKNKYLPGWRNQSA